MPQAFAQNELGVNDEVREPRTADVLPSDVARKRAKGLAYQIDDGWRRSIATILDDRKMTQADLRREIGCSKGALSDALSLKTGKPSSRWVPAIHAVLGLEPPSPTAVVVALKTTEPPAPSTRKRELIHQMVENMTDDQLDAWLAEMLSPRRRE